MQQYQPKGVCPKCGYPMDSGQCPECGTLVASAQIVPASLWSARKRWTRITLMYLGLLTAFYSILWFVCLPLGPRVVPVSLRIRLLTRTLLGPIAFGWIDSNPWFALGSCIILLGLGWCSYHWARQLFLRVLFYISCAVWTFWGLGAAGLLLS